MVRAADHPSTLSTPLVHLPSGRVAPPVLTAEETCELLRFKVCKGSKAVRRLDHYREKGLLPGVQLGKELRFRLVDVLTFIDRQQEEIRR